MFDLGSFEINALIESDAVSLSEMIVRNKEALKTYFPLTMGANLTEKASKKFIAEISEDRKNKIQFLFALKSQGIVAGLVYIKELDWETKEGEFAYCIDNKFSGKGWTTKAVQHLSRHAFDDLGLETLKIIVHNSNLASIKVAEKCGFKFINTLKKEYTPPCGQPLDMELFELRK